MAFAAAIFQYSHLMNGYLIELDKPFTLRNALVYEYRIEVFHI